MTKRRLPIMAFSLSLLALVPNSALAVDAHGNHNAYQFFIGVGGAEGPDVAAAADGSTVTITGMGSLKAGPDNLASGFGPYTIKDPSGNMIASGVWTVTGLVNFVNYGSGAGQGFPNAFGGEAKLDVVLPGFGNGVLTVTCLLGSPPPSKEEGITLVLGRGGNFTEPVHGQTVFVNP